MVRKESKTITTELRNIVLELSKDEKRSLGESEILSNTERVIKNIVDCANYMTLQEISFELYTRTGVNLTISSISKKLKKLGITRKRVSIIPVERNSLDKLNKRSIYAAEISRYSVENLVFLDETGFNAHTTRSYGYSEKNTKAYKNVPANRGQNISCMCGLKGPQ
ncbi:DDE-3 domain-containing protein [Vairimorpha necatrix]|uniref:DDE-3 domain-containing protein n=1 Tax=Vairimorpha necatrix TaxID=6039 RepID=A0AAX4JG65_9MICR